MSQKKRYEKRLSLENLESRQLLSAVPLTANPDFADSTSAYFVSNDDLYVDYSVSEDAPLASPAANVQNDAELAKPVVVTANANKLCIQFEADANELFTVVLKATDAAGKQTVTFKSVKTTAKSIQGDVFAYNFAGKVGNRYDVSVVNGVYTAQQYQANNGIIPAGIHVGSDSVTTLAPLTFVASPGKATAHSITFQQKNGQPIQSLENLTFSAKFDGARVATVYVVEGTSLVNGDNVSPYSVVLNADNTITISGLQLNTKQTFQVSQFSANAFSAYSSNLTIATTKEKKDAPNSVAAAVSGTDSALVTWQGEAGATYTITYTYTDAKGKVTTKSATNKATVNENGAGQFIVSKLLSGTKFTFNVSTNKTKDYDASDFTVSNEITTRTVIPAPVLKSVATTSSSVTFQVTNWDKMEAALQEVDAHKAGGKFAVSVSKVGTDESFIATFSYTAGNGGNGVWSCNRENDTMQISMVQNKSTATVTITGLKDNTEYNFQVEASSSVKNDNINQVVPATSKALKVKTAIKPYNPVTRLSASSPNYQSIDVSWTAEENQKSFLVSLTPTSGTGKTVTKTVSNSNATISGLTPNTEYSVDVVVNADKNGTRSEVASTVAKTLEHFDLVSITKLATNHYIANFGVDMSQFSGRLDFVVAGQGKVYGTYQGYTGMVTDSIAPTAVSLFFGENAGEMANAYQTANPDAKVLVIANEGSAYKMNVLTRKYHFSLNFGFKFRSVTANSPLSSLEFAFDYTYDYDVSGTVKLTGGKIVHNETGLEHEAKMGKTLNVAFQHRN